MTSQPSTPDPLPLASSVLDSPSLENRNLMWNPGNRPNTPRVYGFISGISLRAAFKDHQFLTLFISIPYLGLGTKTSLEGSRTLREYRLHQLEEQVNSPGKKVLVHQTWFLIFDNGLSSLLLCFALQPSADINGRCSKDWTF